MNYPGSTLDDIEVGGGNMAPQAVGDNKTTAPASNQRFYNTLDEPILETLVRILSYDIISDKRDLYQIYYKAKYVMLPGNSDGLTELRNWDLWGPLVFCMLLAITLAISAPDDQKAIVFAAVFVVVWAGAAIITVNAMLLRGTLSFFQTVCVFGYCLFPLNLASIGALIWGNFIFQACLAIAATAWASRAAVGFMAQMVPPKRKVMAVYPVILFYVAFGWMIMLQ